jgi:CPA2 family monovalent cation:H+ antiporter-2
MEGFLFQAALYLMAMLLAVPVASRLGLGSVLGYLAAGIVIGPVLGLVGSETEDLQHFAEFGVVMMLFLIGLELEPRSLWAMRDKLLGLGGLQVVLTTLLIAGGALVLGLDWRVALTVGLILSLSSTAIVLQTLTEKSLMQTPGGRSSFSVLLMQDIAVIPMLALLPLLALPGARAAAEAADGHAATGMQAWIETLPGWGVTLLTLAVVAAIVFGGHYLIRPLYRFVHKARLREINTALALMIVVGIASLMLLVGLSPALGTFLAGVVLANSEFRHEIESDIAPFKGLLLGLFFITVGAGINFDLLFGQPFTIIGLTLAVMIAKGAVLYGLARMFHQRSRNRWLFTLGLAQAGEFGFVLVSFTLAQRILPPALAGQLMLIIALSMLLTPLFFILYDQIVKRLGDDEAATPYDDIDEQQPVLICGVGRFGQVVNRMVTNSGFKTTVIDSDLETVQLLRTFNFKAFYGDPTRPELLKAAGIDSAKILVVAVDDRKAAIQLTAYVRRIRPDIHIIARAHDREHVFQLFRAGANDIVREMFDSSLRAARYTLEQLGLSKPEAAEMERIFFDLDRKTLRRLAEVWKPGVPLEKNKEYVELAISLRSEFETALMTRRGLGAQAEGDAKTPVQEKA